MPQSDISLVCPERLRDDLRTEPVGKAITQVANLVEASLHIEDRHDSGSKGKLVEHTRFDYPIRYRDDVCGGVKLTPDSAPPNVAEAGTLIASLLEHMLNREMAVDDLVSALMTGFEELNLFYSLLPSIATKGDQREIGELLVAETAKTLHCNRVSLLVLDEKRTSYRILAAQGVPKEALDQSIPLADTVASRALHEDELFILNDASLRPDLMDRSRGRYATESFAIVRVPLRARGEALGILTATERAEGAEFTARDRKLLEGLSAMGASALMNCRLHAAVNRQMISTIHALASAVDARDHYTHDHAGRVARLCVATAREMGHTDAVTCREVELAGILHDVGKIGIPDAILSKPSGLTAEEYRTIQSHPKIGARIIQNVPGLERVTDAILHHHERYDGLGYPSALSGEAIPLASTLISVVDTYDALTSDRPYRSACSVEHALLEIKRNKGTQFHPEVVDAFIKVIRREQSHSRNKNNAEDLTLVTASTATG